MTSIIANSQKTNLGDIGFYIPVASLTGLIYGRTSEPVGNTGTLGGSFSTASWAYFGAGKSLSSVQAGAGILKDMGRTVVSSLRTFRKVQLVTTGLAGSNSTLSTFGVGGQQVSLGQDYFTGYIELGFEGNGLPAPVAHFGR
jgi:hypothetical protein